MTDDQPKCTTCKRKRPDQAEAKAAAAAGETPNQKKEKEDELVQNWSTRLQTDGAQRIAPLSTQDQAQLEQIDKLEKLIDILKTMEGKEEEVKKLEADITALNKKKPANSVARDHMDLSRICNRSEEEVEKKITAAKANLQKKMDARDQLVKNKPGLLKSLMEEHQRMLEAHEKQYALQSQQFEAEIAEERKKVEEAEKELMTGLNIKKSALANVSAANTANGATLVPVAPGSIVHSNDVSPQELGQRMLLEPALAGITQDQAAAAATEFVLRFFMAKSLTVAEPTPTVQKVQSNMETAAATASGTIATDQDEDPFSDMDLTGDEAEAARINAEEKGEPFTKKIKVRKSVKTKAAAAAASKSTGA